jgi:hypothetical protein
MRRLAVGRLVGLVVAVAVLAVAIDWGFDSQRLNARFYQAMTARPMETLIDISQTGEVTTPFRQTYSSAHGAAVYLQKASNVPEAFDANLLRPLEGVIIVKDAQGQEVTRAELTGRDVQLRDGQLLLTNLRMFSEGEYQATITINTGVPQLADVPQTVYAQYELCGLERFPATIMGVLAAGIGILGMGLLAVVLSAVWKLGVWKSDVAERL